MRPGVDFVEPIPGLDELAVAEGNLREVAGNPAADVDGGNGFDPPGDLDPLRRDAGLEGDDGHLGHGRRRGGRGRRPCASGQNEAPPDNSRMDRDPEQTAPGPGVRMPVGDWGDRGHAGSLVIGALRGGGARGCGPTPSPVAERTVSYPCLFVR